MIRFKEYIEKYYKNFEENPLNTINDKKKKSNEYKKDGNVDSAYQEQGASLENDSSKFIEFSL